MKNILILNGSPRKNGTTQSLVNSFIEGGKSSGNEVIELYLNGMNIHGCLACESCQKNSGNCVQKDDMQLVYDAFEKCDALVLASPMYWGNITGQLKVVIDRLYAEFGKLGYGMKKDIALIMTARGNDYTFSLDFYSIFTDMLGWKDLGRVLGKGKEIEARKLGESIK